MILYAEVSSLRNTPHVVSAVKSALLCFSAAASSVIIMYSQSGADSESHIFHHSRFTIAASSAVGCCWYCAFHWNTGIDALVRSSASKSKNSGQSGFSVISPVSFSISSIAGNSTTSNWSERSLFVISLTTRPVRSSICHLVWIIATAPPGINRVRAPNVYHSYAFSNTIKLPLITSCSECGSSTSNRWAPRPASAEPTPHA